MYISMLMFMLMKFIFLYICAEEQAAVTVGLSLLMIPLSAFGTEGFTPGV